MALFVNNGVIDESLPEGQNARVEFDGALCDGRADYCRRYFNLYLSRRRVCRLLRSTFRPSM